MEDNKRKLYDALSQDYDLGSFEQFSKDIADSTKRRKLYDATSEEYDFGDYDTFSKQLGFSGNAPEPQPASEPAPVQPASAPEQVQGPSRDQVGTKYDASASALAGDRYGRPELTPEKKDLLSTIGSKRAEIDSIKEEKKAELAAEAADNRSDAERYAPGRLDDKSVYMDLSDEHVLENAALGKGYSVESAIQAGKEYDALKNAIGAVRTQKELDNVKAGLDGLMASPAGREYNLLMQRYNSLVESEDTPENRWALAQTAAMLSRNPIARAEMGKDAPSESQIAFDLNRGEADYLAARMENEDRKARKEDKERLKELNHEVLDNEYYQADVAKRIGETNAELDKVWSRIGVLRNRAYKNKGAMQTVDDVESELNANPEYKALTLAANQLGQTKRKLEHIRDKNTSDFWVNFMDVFTDANTYNFGIGNLETAIGSITALNNPNMKGGETLISAVAGNNAVAQEEGQFVEGKGKYGQIAANSIPFMFEIGMTGGFGGVAKSVESALAKKVGKELSEKFIIKATGAVLGDIAAGAVSANTIGIGKTATDFLNRYYGTLTKDQNGNYVLAGGSDLATALWKTEVSNIAEFSSERFGDHLQHLLGRGILGAGIKAAQKSGTGRVNMAVETLAKTMDVSLKDFGLRSANDIGANWAMKAMSKFIDISNRVGIQGLPFEVAEEYVGLLGNIILGGEEKWMDFSSLGDKETHTDIWGGMLYSIGLTQSFAITTGAVGAGLNGLEKARKFQMLQNSLDSISAAGEELLGKDEWNGVKSILDGSTNKDLPAKIVEFMDSNLFNDQQKSAILDYAKATYLSRGFNAGTIAQARERLVSEDNLASIDINAQVASANDQIADAYMLGYQMVTAKREDVEQSDIDRKSKRSALDAIAQREEVEEAVARQKERMATLTGVENMSKEEASNLLTSETASQEVKDAAVDYLMALAAEEGMNDAQRAFEIRQKSAMIGALEKKLGGKFYYQTPFGDMEVATTQRINPATGMPENIFILAALPNEEGKMPFISAVDGKKGFVSRDEVADADENGNVVQGLVKTTSLNEFMDAQYDAYMVEREARLNAEDAAKQQVREQAEAARQEEDAKKEKQRLRDEVHAAKRDGGYIINGVWGELRNETEEGATFVPDDSSLESRTMTWEQIHREVSGQDIPLNPDSVEPEVKTSAEPEVQEITDTKDYYHGPGSSVEDMLEALYGDEDLLEEEVDEELIAQYDRAKKAYDKASAELAAANPEKIEKQEGESLQAVKERRRIARENYESIREGLEKAVKDTKDELDFWAEAKKVADANIAEREAEAEKEKKRKEAIEKFGVDTTGFDLNPQTAEEAVAEYLGNSAKIISLDDAKKEVFGKQGRVPNELFRHSGNGGILTKKGGRTIQDVAQDIVGHYEGELALSQDQVRDIIIDYLARYTKTEMRDLIFQNRLDAALAEKKELEKAPTEESIPAENAVEEAPEGTDVPEVEEPVSEPAEPEAPAAEGEETPATGPQVNEPGKTDESAPESGENNPENAGKSEGNSVSSQEGETKPEGGKESTYGSGNKVVTKDRYEELRKKFLNKIKGQANAGFDPELFAMGVEMAAYHIEAGARKFVEFAKRMIADIGEAIRPYLKGIYNGARDLPGMEEYKPEMDSAAEVDKIDINADFNTLSDEQNDSNSVREGEGRESEPVPGDTGEGVGGTEEEGGDNTSDGGNPGPDSGEGGSPDVQGEDSGAGEEGGSVPSSAGAEEGEEGNTGGRSGGRGRKDGNSVGRGGDRGRSNDGRRGRKRSGDATAATDGGTESGVQGVLGEEENAEEASSETKEELAGIENAEEAGAKAREAKEKEVKTETNTAKLEAERAEIKGKLAGIEITEESAAERARLSGELEAIHARLAELYAEKPNEIEELEKEKVPYVSVSDPNGERSIGSVVPARAAAAMREAAERVEASVGKPLAQFVMEELGYKTLDEMFSSDGKDTGLSGEQVDAVALAIYQIKNGKMLINGDMTGIGKGRVGAAIIRWAKLHGKKCIFATQSPGLFSDMYRDLTDIGSGYKSESDPGLLPFIVNDKDPGNKNKSTVILNSDKEPVVKSPTPTVKHDLWDSDGDTLPTIKGKGGPANGPQRKGRTYDFLMMTYSQAQSTRGTWAKKKLSWIKKYAKDAIIICDESHLAAGEGSGRGEYFQDIAKKSQGTLFMSATFAKKPQCMVLYAVKSSMSDARVPNKALIETVENFGIPMQEYLASALYKTGEMVRRERDFSDVKTEWLDPKVSYGEQEYKSYRDTNDKTIKLVRAIIAFQRAYIEPMIAEKNQSIQVKNAPAKLAGEGWFYSYTNTAYSSQVSNICNLLFYAMKAKKSADIAIEKMKNGEKAVIVVDNTLEGYISQIKEAVEKPDFTAIFEKGVKSILEYRYNQKWMKLDREATEEQGKEVWVEDEEKRVVTEIPSIRDEFDDVAEAAYNNLLQAVKDFSEDKSLAHLSLSPIDYIKELISDAGFRCGEITGRKVELVKNDDGLYECVKRDDERKDAEHRFNGGTKKNPLPESEQYGALIINSAGSTGISLHSSRRFGNQAKRNMIIVQPAKDPNVEVQTRGRTDRTGQVSRSNYYYITSPIPAEYKIVMMLRKKLASLDAQSVGTENVSSNKVDADDMDNKYGDEVAKDFLAEHPEINVQLDRPITQEKDKASNEMVWKGYDGLLYNLLIGMQRMTCDEQELIIKSLQESYIELIEYHNQNNSNELSSTVMNLDAVTIDEGVFIHGKDDKSISVFAHDSKLERMQVNVLKKPLRSEQIYVKMNQLGAITEDGKIDPYYGDRIVAKVGEYVSAAKEKLKTEQQEAREKLKTQLLAAHPDMTAEEIEKDVQMVDLVAKQLNERDRINDLLGVQQARVEYATNNLKPGAIVMVPLVDGKPSDVPYGFGRFIGFKQAKDGKPTGVKAVFAVKDSRSSIDVPVVKMKDVIIGIAQHTADSRTLFSSDIRDIGGRHDATWITDEERREARDQWWDSRTPQKSRTIAYMITGNLLQSGAVLSKYKGTMCVFTRKDPETGRVSLDTGMLLAPNFDPENFHVGEIVTKDYVWNTGNAVHDNESHITVYRAGNNMVIEFQKRNNERLSNHPVNNDETIKELMLENDFNRTKNELSCTIPEEKVEEALDHLFHEYGFTRDTLFIMPDSGERVDAIVPDNRPFDEIIKELGDRHTDVWSYSSAENALRSAMNNYKLDIDNEDLIQRIKELVALRQAYYRKYYASWSTGDLLWEAFSKEGEIELYKESKQLRDRAFGQLQAIKNELAYREGNKGHLKHFKQGEMSIDEIEKIFKEFNSDKENAEIAKKLFAKFRAIKRLRVPIVFNEKIINSTGGFSQGQVVQYNWKYLNADWILDQMKANVLIHEMTHTLTVYAHEAVKQGYEHLLQPEMVDKVRELETIYRAINNDKELAHELEGQTYYDYGNKNWEEMLAEAASNPEFRDHLKKIKLIKTIDDGDVTFSKVREGQDVSGKKVVSAYDAIMERLNKLLDAFSESAVAEIYRGTGYGESRLREQDVRYRGRMDEYSPVFYSNAEDAVLNIQMDKATPEQWLKMIESRGGMKAGEDKWLGLSDWLKSLDRKTVTKQEVLDYIRSNEIQVEDVSYSERGNIEQFQKENPAFFDAFDVEDDELGEPEVKIGDLDKAVALYNRNNEVELHVVDGDLEEGDDGYDDLLRWANDFFNVNLGGKINTTRLDYTTSGLTDKKEIALVVPTIESWNERDDIHFGDAGIGRAVAWVRFGDAESLKTDKPLTEDERYEAGKKLRQALRAKSEAEYEISHFSGKRLEDARAKLSNAEKTLAELYETYGIKPGDEYGKTLVIDEIQSKRHQEGRSKGYKDKKVIELERKLRRLNEIRNGILHDGNGEKIAYTNEMAAERRALQEEYNSLIGAEYYVEPSDLEIWEDKYQYYTIYDGRRYSVGKGVVGSKEYSADYLAHYINNEITHRNNERISDTRKRIPDAPFEKNWQELAMKRMLRYAAENGYDYVAWTTGDQQAERYNLSNVIYGIETVQYHDGTNKREVYLNRDGAEDIQLTVDADGVVTWAGRYHQEFVGKKLSDIIGKDLAEKTMATETDEAGNAEVVAEGQDLRVGGEGMRGFYDEILPRFMNKYGKKWGVSVSDIYLPNLSEESTRVMHSIPVTPEMRASVLRGQPMFRDASSSVSENLRAPVARARAIAGALELANGLGIKFKEDPSLKAKGLFDPKTGQIRINVDAHDSAEDLQATILHEAVAHYGLRKLLGKDFADAMKDVYAGASKSVKERIDALAAEHGLSTDVATEEYLAELAEDGRFTPEDESIWQKAWYAIRQALVKLGLRLKLTDADLRHILYASYRNLQTRGAVAQAQHVAVMNSLRRAAEESHKRSDDNGPDDTPGGGSNGPSGDVSAFDAEKKEGFNELPEDVKEEARREQASELYRRASNSANAGTAAQVYGDKVRTVGSALYEVGVDEYHPVDILTNALADESGKALGDDERVSDKLRETGGKAMHAIREYDKNFLLPMWDAVGEFMAKAACSVEETERYLALKSGLERNEVLAKRDARKDYETEYRAVENEANAEIRKINIKEKKEKEKLDAALANGKISDVTYSNETTRLKHECDKLRGEQNDIIKDAKSVYDAHVAAIDAGSDPRYQEYRKKDYSAITTWAKTADVEDAEQMAQDYVDDMESRAGANVADELWNRINAATKETLRFQYEHDILTKEQYNDVSKMMKYYVPMRGFAEDTAEDLYNYYVTAQSNDFQPTLLSAGGRTTLFEGPLGNIGAMHSSAVSQGVKNEAKLSLLNLVRNRPSNSLATVTRAWFVNTNVKGPDGKYIYQVAYPNIPDGADLATREAIIKNFEDQMHDLWIKGEAYNSHREVDLHGGVVAFEKEAHKNEHMVKVREGGREYGIIINGNPAAAQAINGVKRGKGAGEKLLDVMRVLTRTLSQMFTTLSVPFWVSNFQRDAGQGLTNAFIRNDKGYLGRYLVNYAKALKVFPMLVSENGMEKRLAKSDPVAALFKEYLENGGPMGQNRIEDNEYFERQMERYLSNSGKHGVIAGAKAVLDFIAGVGEAVETVTRFAVFQTSREAGRSIHESISDAKEITTNFARKGSGRAFTSDELKRMKHRNGKDLNRTERAFVNALAIGVEVCRASIPFFNAAIQGLQNKVVNYRDHTAKTLLADSIYFMLGLGMRLLLAGAGGDDDKERYTHTSDYLRRNNILTPLGDGVYSKWALPQEYRVMFALGDIVGSAVQQDRPVEDLAADAFGSLMQLSPIGAVTDEVVFNPQDKKRAWQTLLTNAAPGTIAPVLESVFNRDFKGARLYNEGFNENLRAYPGWTKSLPTTGEEYVAAAKFLNNITGGNDVERGWVNLNPAIVEHLVESYFSGPYQIVVRGPEAIAKGIKGEATVRDIPLLNRLLLNTNDNQRDAYYSNMYYFFKEKQTEAARIYGEYKSRTGKEVDRFMNSKDYQYMKVFDIYSNMEKSIRAAGKKAEKNGDKAGKEDADQKIQDIHEKIAKRCLDIYFDRDKVK